MFLMVAIKGQCIICCTDERFVIPSNALFCTSLPLSLHWPMSFLCRLRRRNGIKFVFLPCLFLQKQAQQTIRWVLKIWQSEDNTINK